MRVMRQPGPNPHLHDYAPSSWDPPFKRWVLGVGLSIFLTHLGFQDVLTGVADVPVPRSRFGGGEWMEVSGADAYSFGCAQIGLALFLHGRYFWRLHSSLWKFYPLLSGFGAIVCAVGTILTYALLLKTHLENW